MNSQADTKNSSIVNNNNNGNNKINVVTPITSSSPTSFNRTASTYSFPILKDANPAPTPSLIPLSDNSLKDQVNSFIVQQSGNYNILKYNFLYIFEISQQNYMRAFEVIYFYKTVTKVVYYYVILGLTPPP